MKRLICGFLVASSILAARAQGLPPESFGGALWGALFGGILGGDCHNGFSGTGAAIGAGVGFIAGTIAGEARRSSGEPYPGYTTVSVSAGCPAYAAPYVYHAPNRYCAPSYDNRPAAAVSVSTTVVAIGHAGKTAKPVARPHTTTTKPVTFAARQIPDAPRVPDAPTF